MILKALHLHIKKLCLLAVALLCCAYVQAQSVAQLEKAGDKKFADGEYYAAAVYYKDAINKSEEDAGLYYKLAETSRLFNDYAAAAEAYKQTAKFDTEKKYPLANFWYPIMLKSTCECKYQDVAKLYQKFATRYKKDDYYARKTQQEIASTAWAIDHLKKNDSIQIEHLDKEVNTEKSEFNPIPVYPDRLQFSSLRNLTPDKKEKDSEYLVRIYNQLPNPQEMYMPNGSSFSMHIGNGAYDHDITRFYFTQCETEDKSDTRCDIYVSKFDGYHWGAAEKLPKEINDYTATNTQPALGYDSKGNEVLFFVSNRKGGMGGLDIWVSKITSDSTYAPAVNLGSPVNTEGNEVTPFYDRNNKKLFIASDWHYGYGGYDIFETHGEYTAWSKPKNLLQPINSAQNDLYYVLTPDNHRAYLSSNRKGSLFIEAETCCSDIYAYNTGKRVDKPVVPEVKKDTPDAVVPIDTPITVAKLDTPVTVAILDTPVVIPPKNVIPETTTTAEIPPRKFVDESVKHVKQLLPVTLYFHNDEPDCCNLRDTTKLDYKETYESYSAKLSEYRKEFGKGLTQTAKTQAEQEVFDLFTRKVDKGFYDLVAFSSQLLELLQKGDKMEVTIKGYCSPLNYNQYNIKLGYRRVASLRNYFYHYRDGILLPYIAEGKLVLKNESIGEETAPKNLSDKLEDTRNSVYNPAVAIERRVEIVSVEIK